ncbi:hypothetical protein [Dawidia soli]|uniref:Uncharacterized protein n=1 Tax=Dawidia soli TaxID=2782352 RepID=A0AAP2GKP3_9BACT|nr:hypothetical protein [Dawidia soli]MBT1689243.1 hypothetical protein [Dawidia soli]
MRSYQIKAMGSSEEAIHDFADVLEEDGLNIGVSLVNMETGHGTDQDEQGARIVELTWTTGEVCPVPLGVFTEYVFERLKARFGDGGERFTKEEVDGFVGIVDAQNGARIVFATA